MHHQPIPHPPSASETDTRAALTWAERRGGVLPVLTAFADPGSSLEWKPDLDILYAPAAQGGHLMVALEEEEAGRFELTVTLNIGSAEWHESAVIVPAHVFAAGD